MSQNTDPHQSYASGGWSLDRKLSASVLAVLLLQGAAGIWWAATITGDVAGNQKTIAAIVRDFDDMEDDVDRQREQNAEIVGRVIRLEEKVEQGNALLVKILDALQD